MAQTYKSVYFADYPPGSDQQGSLTIAFGEDDRELYGAVRRLSSHELRQIIGHSTYASLRDAADSQGRAVNSYCVRRLHEVAAEASGKYAVQLKLFPRKVSLAIDPIQATFRGGQCEPLHEWYPLLQGYSPKFVEEVIRQFAPDAERVLDPFSGLGTTPITVARMGKHGFYCELNPLFQFLTEVKLDALIIPSAERNRLAALLRETGERFEDLVSEAEADRALAGAYGETFGESRFFEPAVYDLVLRARTVVDAISCTEPLFGRLLCTAVVSALVPASLLIRRGDLRFKTAEERKKKDVAFIPCVQERVERIASDLARLEPLAERPVLVCEDARQLEKFAPLGFDAVVTSPPYLNGTNYYRNTKIELWFLRCLRSAEELSALRRRAVTSGINNVTVHSARGRGPDGVRAVVEDLEACAYDRRIPHMVDAYFTDLAAVFHGLKAHLTPGARVMVDIGDSCYCGVHVPTDSLLVELLELHDLRLEHELTLRERMSRNGLPLRQVLLVFQNARRRARTIAEGPAVKSPSWSDRWETFKDQLPHQQGEYAKRNWGHALHSLCSYQGKMKPALAFHLVSTFLPEGGRMLDPFGGVGTIPFEAALNGIQAWAFEISTAALHVARAKLAKPDSTHCKQLMNSLEEFLSQNEPTENEVEAAREISFNKEVPSYFSPQTLAEVLLARRFFKRNPPSDPDDDLVFSALMHILHGNRPYALSRRSHPITPFAPSGPREYRPLMPRLRDKVERSLSAERPEAFVPGQAVFQDATSWWPHEVDNLDAIITSPPFYDSTRFYLANWMRLWFAGWEARDFQSKPSAFIEVRQKESFSVYAPVFRQARERLKPGGVMVLHLGESRKCDMAEALGSVARPWFEVYDMFSESVEHCESHGIRDKGTVTAHQYLVLR